MSRLVENIEIESAPGQGLRPFMDKRIGKRMAAGGCSSMRVTARSAASTASSVSAAPEPRTSESRVQPQVDLEVVEDELPCRGLAGQSLLHQGRDVPAVRPLAKPAATPRARHAAAAARRNAEGVVAGLRRTVDGHRVAQVLLRTGWRFVRGLFQRLDRCRLGLHDFRFDFLGLRLGQFLGFGRRWRRGRQHQRRGDRHLALGAGRTRQQVGQQRNQSTHQRGADQPSAGSPQPVAARCRLGRVMAWFHTHAPHAPGLPVTRPTCSSSMRRSKSSTSTTLAYCTAASPRTITGKSGDSAFSVRSRCSSSGSVTG